MKRDEPYSLHLFIGQSAEYNQCTIHVSFYIKPGQSVTKHLKSKYITFMNPLALCLYRQHNQTVHKNRLQVNKNKIECSLHFTLINSLSKRHGVRGICLISNTIL